MEDHLGRGLGHARRRIAARLQSRLGQELTVARIGGDIFCVLGNAQSVNPDVETLVVNTSSWCDPAKQAEAAASLISQGVDVITQHQDCTGTITKEAEAANVKVVGYHADASELAPKGWITGSECRINSNTTVGSPQAPVLLISAATLTRLNGGANIYGILYVSDAETVSAER